MDWGAAYKKVRASASEAKRKAADALANGKQWVGRKSEQAGQRLQQIKDATVEKSEEVKRKTAAWYERFKKGAADKAEDIKQDATEKVEQAKERAGEVRNSVVSAYGEVATFFKDTVPSAVEECKKSAKNAAAAAASAAIIAGSAVSDTTSAAAELVVDTVQYVYVEATSFHFEGREARNVNLPTYEEAEMEGSGWRKMTDAEAIYHQDKIPGTELKFVNETTGGEVVFSGIANPDGSRNIITDPLYAGTYNYVTVTAKPEYIDIFEYRNVKEWGQWGATAIGHGVTDVVPYWFGGNIRGPENSGFLERLNPEWK